jgi:hypothetical protein
MNYTKLFYWLTVADNAKTLFVTFIWIFTIISVIATFFYFILCEDEKGQTMCRKWMWWSYPFMILFWSLYIFTPSKKDALLIVAGGQTLNFLTTDSTSKQIPHELSSFVVTELKNMAENAKVDLNIASQKDKILEEAKNMTANQLMDKMRVDSNFAKVILNK